MVYFCVRKFLIILLATITIITLNIPNVFGIEESTKLTNEDAQNALKKVIPDVKILDVRSAEIKGLWEVVIETKGRKGIIYLDSSKNYAIIGSILDLETKANLTRERFLEINKADVSQIPLGDALVMGDKNAKHRVIVFDDPD
jgi:thiol:disulfide interchange protein DsbC